MSHKGGEIGQLSLLLGGDYDRTRALLNGTITIEGCKLQIDLEKTAHDVFHTLCCSDEYDGGELSLSFYSTLVSKYGPDTRFVALPVFVSRMFRHGNLLVNANSGISSPKDLEGRKCGVPEYGMTMAVWVRGFLRHEYGVDTDAISWVTGRPPVALLPSELVYPKNIAMERGVDQKQLVRGLSEGKFDAYIGPVPRELPPNVRRLFPDYGEEERRYYRKTSIFPIMHVFVLRRAAYERNRSVIAALYKALVQAKDMALEELWASGVQRVSLPWLLPEVEKQWEAFGGDLWSYGAERNRATVDAYLSYAHEQGLLWRKVAAEELFVSTEELS